MMKARAEHYAASLLDTDVAVIDANEQHVVVAIRIPRAKIAANHSILRVLSDFATDTDRPPS